MTPRCSLCHTPEHWHLAADGSRLACADASLRFDERVNAAKRRPYIPLHERRAPRLSLARGRGYAS